MRLDFIIIGLSVWAISGWAAADSLFTQAAAKSGTLVSEKKARFELGDIITVMVREKIDASTSADTNTKKESDVQSEAKATDNEFLVANEPGGLNLLNPEMLPNWDIGMKNETKARGKTQRTSSLVTSIAAVVMEVYPNGNVLIQGEKRVTVNREDSLLVVSGIIRAKDVSPANTILSTQIANAQVQLRGKGELWNNQRRGLFTKVLDWFSPF